MSTTFFLVCNYIRLDREGKPLRGRPNSDGYFDTEAEAIKAAINAGPDVYVVCENDGERVGEVSPNDEDHE